MSDKVKKEAANAAQTVPVSEQQVPAADQSAEAVADQPVDQQIPQVEQQTPQPAEVVETVVPEAATAEQPSVPEQATAEQPSVPEQAPAEPVQPATPKTKTKINEKTKATIVEENLTPQQEQAQKDLGSVPVEVVDTPAAMQGAEIQLEEYDPETTDVTALLTEVVTEAYHNAASDIHIEPEEEDIVIRFRVDGLLRVMRKFNKALQKQLVFKIKVDSKLRTDQHFAPQDGRISFLIDEIKLDTRISILPTSHGEKVVIRLLSKEGKNFSLETLGMQDQQLEKVRKSYQKPYGMIISAGPTGSGKTTTLYSVLDILNSRDRNITTVEDPVEYEMTGVNQVQINVKADLTFANGLRAILRQDPDIIMVGEIRDSETARIAINAAMTGHLVLSTIHTNDSITTIPRLIDMGVEPFLVASTLNVVVAQRLVRKLCETCKTEKKVDDILYDELKKVRPDIAEVLEKGAVHFVSQGCQVCNNTGYKGRIGIYEVLELTESMRKMIVASKDVDAMFKLAREEGLTLIMEDGIKKVHQGVVSISELIRVTALKD
jgi:type II secretory ATPase GspE/PulE/Tfp pilus assembly ATPase PilB-like protein